MGGEESSMGWLIAVLGALLVFTAILAYGLFRKALLRPAAPDPENETALQASRWFAYGPILKPGVKWLKERPWQEERVTAADGAELRGFRYDGREEKPLLILLHDYGSSPWIDFCLTARWAVRQGWSVLLPVERAHGESGGRWCTLGLLEGEDCLLWIEKAARQRSADCRVVLGGVGLGAAALLSAMKQGLPSCVCAVLLDSAWVSPKEQIRYMVKDRLHMRAFLLLRFLYLMCRLHWGRAPGSLNGTEVLKENRRVPVFFAQGKQDSMTPYAPVEQAYRDCSAPKRLFTGENAGHGACCFIEGERYFTELEDFLREQLGERFPLRERTKNPGTKNHGKQP